MSRAGQRQDVAVITFVFNEAVNLPIWRRYYGDLFGEQNLFVVDRESSDGSTENVNPVNLIRIPRDEFDDIKKAKFVSSLQNALLQYYKFVIYTDCDEIIVPDPACYKNLLDYTEKLDADYATCIALNLLHLITIEEPLKLNEPILKQRRFVRYRSAGNKTLISRIPFNWLAGHHCADVRPQVDKNLFLIHTKAMDYSMAVGRQRINQETSWSDIAVQSNHGAHHRYGLERFVREHFLDPINMMNQDQFTPFEFDQEARKFDSEIQEKNGVFWIPMNHSKFTELPDRFRSVF
jgi:hypothetical protein